MTGGGCHRGKLILTPLGVAAPAVPAVWEALAHAVIGSSRGVLVRHRGTRLYALLQDGGSLRTLPQEKAAAAHARLASFFAAQFPGPQSEN